MLVRGREVTAAQLNNGQHGVRGRGVPVRVEGPGDGQSRPGCGGGLRQPAACQVDAGTQQGQRRLRRDTLQRRIVRGAEDVPGRHSSRHNMHERASAAQGGDAYFYRLVKRSQD